MNQNELNKILDDHKLWLRNKGGKRADLREVDLRNINLSNAGLRYADLRYAYLLHANLRSADLRYTNLRYAYLRSADLTDADLWSADLWGADLSDATLIGANLRYANLDFSCLPLCSGSKGMIVDRRIAAQIAAHFCALTCDDPDYQAARSAILEFAKTSHRASDLGLKSEE